MPEPVRIRSESSQLAELLRRRIRNNPPGAPLPGQRKLREEYAVSRTTVERALAELENEGCLVAAGPSRSRRGNSRSDSNEDTGALLVFDLPPELRTGEHRVIAERLSDEFHATHLRLDSHTTATAEVVSHILSHAHRRIILLDHRAEVADRLTESGRTVVTLNAPGRPTACASVAICHESLVRGALTRCFDAGHTRVSTLLWRRKPEVAANMRRWVREEYAARGLRHHPDFDAPIVLGDSPAELHAGLLALLRHTPPSALILSDYSQWIAALGVLGHLRLRVPEEVSLVCLCASPDWRMSFPAPACFSYPVSRVIRAVKNAFEDAEAGRAPERRMIKPTWVPGGTLRAR